tara:strand:+ start:364 stop:501 length:138 start_codon:yes stop_codon:yes gene_type:complete
MDDKTKKLINRLESENKFLRAVIENNYNKAKKALKFINSKKFNKK